MRQIVKSGLISFAAFTSLALAPSAFAGDSLEIQDFIGTINWSTGPMSVAIDSNPGDTKITGRSNINVMGGYEKIDGSDCKSAYGKFDIEWFGKRNKGHIGGYKNLEDYPVLEITVPADIRLIIRNAIIFTRGAPDFEAVDIQLRHCGDVTLGNVKNTLALDSRGSADVSVERTGQMVANLKGSGDLTGGDSGDVLLNSKGSADVELGDIASLELKIHGSGDVEVGDIDGAVELSSHGSGDTEIGRVNGELSYIGHGSGDFEAASVRGPQIYLKSHGSGDIEIGDGAVTDLDVSLSGSGSVEFSGQADRADLRTSGSGDVSVGHVLGAANVRSSGSGEIDIDKRG